MTRILILVVGLLSLHVPAFAEQWRAGDTIALRWACPNIRGALRAHMYFSRGPVSDRDAEAYLRRKKCHVKGVSAQLDARLVEQLVTYDGRPAAIWRLWVEGRVMYGVVLDT